MEGPVKTPLTTDDITDYVNEAKDYAYASGFIMQNIDEVNSQDCLMHAPFSLFPSPVPRLCYQKALAVQKDFNLLMHRVAHDYHFLKESLQSVIKVDDFTRRLWHIYETVQNEGVAQPLYLEISRSDYMFDTSAQKSESKEIQLKQIEFQTISPAIAGFSVKLRKLHKFVLEKVGLPESVKNIPENDSVRGIAKALVTAWEAYNKQNSVVVFLVEPRGKNIIDQRAIQYAIQKLNPNVKVVRKTFQDFSERAVLSSDKSLIIDDLEVAVVYQRSGSRPEDYRGDQHWEARLLIERSKAIKCPSINYHLAGTKKIQQVLSKPGIIEKYLTNQTAIDNIRSTFAGQYSLDLKCEGDENTKMAMKNPKLFVLKPQREGGGNNFFGTEIKVTLEKLGNSEERTAFILMDRIHPMKMTNYPVRLGNEVKLVEMVSELGIYGTLVGSQDDVILNEGCGYLLRTKPAEEDEGGVDYGFGVIDSPYLV